MKYIELEKIARFLNKREKIIEIRRIANMAILINFKDIKLIFDLQEKSIYEADQKYLNEFKAPFDILIKKYINNSIFELSCLKNNRILEFICKQNLSYKSLKSKLFLEFTGRFTNAILTDENHKIITALRHKNTEIRPIIIGKKLDTLPEIEIKESEAKKLETNEDFIKYFKENSENLEKNKLENFRKNKLIMLYKKLEKIKQILKNIQNETSFFAQSDENYKLANEILLNKNSNKKEADLLFDKAKKLKLKANGIKIQRQNIIQKIDFIENLINLTKKTNNKNHLEALASKKSKKQEQSNEFKVFFYGEYKILIGKNEKGNEKILKDAKKDDIWMHLKNITSPHIIIKTNKSKISEDVLEFAGKICLAFSKINNGKYELDYTKRKNLKLNGGANVNYNEYKSIWVNKE